MIYTVAYGGERLDRIARAVLRSERGGTVKALLAANPGLAALSAAGGVVPGGTEIVVPEDFQPAVDAGGVVLAWE